MMATVIVAMVAIPHRTLTGQLSTSDPDRGTGAVLWSASDFMPGGASAFGRISNRPRQCSPSLTSEEASRLPYVMWTDDIWCGLLCMGIVALWHCGIRTNHSHNAVVRGHCGIAALWHSHKSRRVHNCGIQPYWLKVEEGSSDDAGVAVATAHPPRVNKTLPSEHRFHDEGGRASRMRTPSCSHSTR